MGEITVFLRDDKPVGSCPQGQEAEWRAVNRKAQASRELDPDSTIVCTEEKAARLLGRRARAAGRRRQR